MKQQFAVQVPAEHYQYENYDNKLNRFILYYHQLKEIVRTKPHNVLEVGIGNKTIVHILRQAGFSTTTCDFDAQLKPDKVGDIRNLPFPDASFDTAVAFEILEHLPFEDFEKSLQELKRVSKKYVILSMPYNRGYFEALLRYKVPFSARQLHLMVTIPYFLKTIKIGPKNTQHHWEIGVRNYPLRRIKRSIRKYFVIEREFAPIMDLNHYFFVLRKP
ncbi:MAG TPA: methyltransferase domain-containing protein [Candidatus Binatia bacterium]|nr:methyltransferase domain-containing protein [Candidatus Binatia bacterium]